MKPRFPFGTASLALGLALALGLVALASSSLSACTKKDTEAPSPSASASAASLPNAAAVDGGGPGPLAPGETLSGRLADEAEHRPAIKPNADDIFAAFDRAGAPVPRKQQSLGRTYKAPFCVGGYTNDTKLAINVCEYPDEAAAAAGLAVSKSAFPGMTNRKVWNHKTTTVTLIEQVQGDSKVAAVEKKLSDVYMGL